MILFSGQNDSNGLDLIFPRQLALECGIIYITEALAAELPEEIERYKEQVMPAIIQIPGVSGNKGAGVEGVKKTVEQAVGSDILFSQE